MKTATPDRQAAALAASTQTTTAIIQHNDDTASTEVRSLAQAEKPAIRVDDVLHRVRRVRTKAANLGRHADGALVIALLAPPALIALLMALGLQFAFAVCVMFACVFLVTTSADAMWIWRRHTDRENHWDLD